MLKLKQFIELPYFKTYEELIFQNRTSGILKRFNALAIDDTVMLKLVFAKKTSTSHVSGYSNNLCRKTIAGSWGSSIFGFDSKDIFYFWIVICAPSFMTLLHDGENMWRLLLVEISLWSICLPDGLRTLRSVCKKLFQFQNSRGDVSIRLRDSVETHCGKWSPIFPFDSCQEWSFLK